MNIPDFYSFILAEIFGIFILIMTIIMLSKREYYEKMISKLQADNPVIFVGASFSLLLGVALVETHSVWELKYRLAVTLFSWVLFIASIFWLSFPYKMLNLTKKLFSGNRFYWCMLIMALINFIVIARSAILIITHHVAHHV